MLNVCTLTGNLGADPEVFYSSEGTPVSTFNLAFRLSKKKTGWIKITCFNRLAEISERHLHKGARIAVCGAGSTGGRLTSLAKTGIQALRQLQHEYP